MTDKRQTEGRLERAAMERSQQANAHLILCHAPSETPPTKTTEVNKRYRVVSGENGEIKNRFTANENKFDLFSQRVIGCF